LRECSFAIDSADIGEFDKAGAGGCTNAGALTQRAKVM